MSGPYVIRADGGTITVAPGVLETVTRRAAESVADVHVRRRGLEINLDGDRARVSLGLAVRHGAVLPDVARDVQRRVAEQLRTMCGVDPAAVDVAVEELVAR